MLQEDFIRSGIDFPDNYDRKYHRTFVSDEHTLGDFLEFLAEVPDYVPLVVPPIIPPDFSVPSSSSTTPEI
jgi:hypothetical protein